MLNKEIGLTNDVIELAELAKLFQENVESNLLIRQLCYKSKSEVDQLAVCHDFSFA